MKNFKVNIGISKDLNLSTKEREEIEFMSKQFIEMVESLIIGGMELKQDLNMEWNRKEGELGVNTLDEYTARIVTAIYKSAQMAIKDKKIPSGTTVH